MKNNIEKETLIEKNKSLTYELFKLSKESKEIQDNLNKEISQLKEISSYSENKIQELEKVIFLMENSLSWKTTEFARQAGRIARKSKELLLLLPIAIKKKEE